MRTILHGYAVEFKQDHQTWKWRTLPNGVWSAPFLTLADCRRNASEELQP